MLLSPVSPSIAPPVPPRKHPPAGNYAESKRFPQTKEKNQILTNRTHSQIIKIPTPSKTDASITSGLKEETTESLQGIAAPKKQGLYSKAASLINDHQKISITIGAAGGITALSLLAYKCFEIFSQAQTQNSILCATDADNQWIELIPCQTNNNAFIPCEPSENLVCPSLCAFDKTEQKLFEPDWETLSKPYTCSRNPTSTTLEFFSDLSPDQMKSLQCDREFIPAWCTDLEYFCVKNNERWQPIYDCKETSDTFFENCNPSADPDCTSLCTENMEGDFFPITWIPSKCIEQFNKTGTFLQKLRALDASDLNALGCKDPKSAKAWCPNE